MWDRALPIIFLILGILFIVFSSVIRVWTIKSAQYGWFINDAFYRMFRDLLKSVFGEKPFLKDEIAREWIIIIGVVFLGLALFLWWWGN